MKLRQPPPTTTMRRFPAAPWPMALKLMSLAGTVLICAVSYGAYRVVPVASGFTHAFGVGVALMPLAVVVIAAFFTVRGFRVDRDALLVERLVTCSTVPLAGLTEVWADPGICQGSLRVFGNGGLFSLSGWFRNDRLGRYRLFATDWQDAVVLRFSDRRAIVITPAAPEAFVEHLRRIIPGLRARPEEGD